MMGRVDSLIATGNTIARSLVEGFSMSEIVCLVSEVVMSRLLFRVCIELGGQHQIIYQGTCPLFVILC